MFVIIPMYAQKIGITNTATFTPNYLLHIHDYSATTGTLLQLTNSNSGSLTTDGFKINLNTGKIEFVNQENAAMSFFTYNTERMYIDASGKVGIGTTSPAADLDVGGLTASGALRVVFGRQSEGNATGSGTFLGIKAWGTQLSSYNGKMFSIENAFYGDLNSSIEFYRGGSTIGGFMTFTTNNGTERLRIDGSGNVGIGTTSPSKKLDVSGDINFTGALYVNGSAGSSGQLLYSNAGGTNGWLAAGTSGQILISTGGVPGWNTLASINGVTTSCGTTNYVPKMSGTTTLSCSQIYDNVTGVGIGTTNPGAKFEIYNSAALPALSIGDNGTDNASTYGMVNLTRPADLTRAHLAFIRTGNYVWQMGYVQNTNTFGIFPWNLTSAGTPTIAFTTNSYVGIGTTSPSKKLDVTGDINFTGALYANGSAGASGQLLYSNAGATNGWLGVGTSGQILLSTGGVPSWQNPGGTDGYTRAVIPIASFGGEVLINSTSWQRVTRTTYTSLSNLFSGVPVMSGYTRKYYVVIRKADNQPGGIGSYWRFACDGAWNGGNDVAGHGFSLSSDWGSLQEGTTYWIEIPPTAVSGSGAGTQYWKIDAKMANASTSMRVMYISIAAVDVFAGTNTAYSAAGSGNATFPPMSMLYENIWSTGTSGNVGIGTMSPNFKADIQSDITMSGDINPGSAQLSVGGTTTPGKRMILGYDVTGNGYGFIKAGNYGVAWTNLALQPNGGNVGIGTTVPGKKLDVQGGASFGSGTYQSGSIVDIGSTTVDYPANSGWASSYNSNILLSGLDYTTISFHDAGATVGELGHISNSFFFDGGQAWGPISLGINTRTPGYTLDLNGGTFAFGTSNVRTETRTDAGLQGNAGAQSGFYENGGSSVTNYPAGASGWWHMIDCRHNNPANNYALQIAGSFFDQDLYYRKTNNDATTPWLKLQKAITTYTYNSNADLCVSGASWLDFPNCTTTLTLTVGQKVKIIAQGGSMADSDCNGASNTTNTNFDVRMAVNGSDFPDGAWIRSSVDNHNNTGAFTSWSIAGTYDVPSTGSYTFTLQARVYSGSSCMMGGGNTSSLQATMIVEVTTP
jgi:hypothetical protein